MIMNTLLRFSLLFVVTRSIMLSVAAVGIGDTRESVIVELGEPESHMPAGKREFLNYCMGRIELTSGGSE
jgi:hypothetical protein